MIELLVVIKLTDRMTRWFPHGQLPDIGQKDVNIFNLMLETVLCDIHMVAAFYEIALAIAHTTVRPKAGMIRYW